MSLRTPPLASGRPLLKWAGGKRQLLAALRAYYPERFDRYIEPFAGGAAVFFDLHAAGRLDGRAVVLADVNADLIGCYRAVRDDAEAVIATLAALDEEHRARPAVCYYEVRDRRFNPSRARLGARVADAYTPALAAMLIYLNRTGFNGLFRLNRHGGFNVPAGRYANPRICDPDHIRACARALAAPGVVLACARFDETLASVLAGDFVYCDPPYAPLSRTASFAQYTAGGFGRQEHRQLQQAVVAAARRGAMVLVSNSTAPEIEAAYAAAPARRAGLIVERVWARRAINSRSDLRGAVHEIVVSNARAPLARASARTPFPMLKAAGPARSPRRRPA